MVREKDFIQVPLRRKENMKAMAIAVAITLFSLLALTVESAVIGRLVKIIFGLITLTALSFVLILNWPFCGQILAKAKESGVIVVKSVVYAAKCKPLTTIIIVALLIALRIVGHLYSQNSWAKSTEPQIISPGVVYYHEMSDKCRVHVLEIDLEQARPQLLMPENFTFGKETLVSFATKSQVCGAINGDLFDEGGPQGLMATSSRYSAPNTERCVLEFGEDLKSAEVELFRFSTTAGVTIAYDKFPIRRSYNAMYVPGDVGIYSASRGIGSGAGRVKNLLQARVKLDSWCKEGAPFQSGTITEVFANPKKNAIPGDKEVILTAGNQDSIPPDIGVYAWARANFIKGERVDIELPMTPPPGSLIIGGGPEIMRNGQYIVSDDENQWCRVRNARTVVGITTDKKRLLVMVAEGPPKIGSRDLKQSLYIFPRFVALHALAIYPGFNRISSGMSMQEAYRYLSKKRVYGKLITSAINLDGGGSTTMVIKKSEQIVRVNTTTEGKDRPLANGLGFTSR